MMRNGEHHDVPAANRWTSRIAIFSLVVLLTAAVLHRVGLPTAVAFNLAAVGYFGALLAFVLGLYGVIGVWRYGDRGAARCVVGIGLSVLMFMGLGAVAWIAMETPEINDISTDVQSPPKFVELAKLRGGGNNPAVYPERFAGIQAAVYPDLKTLIINRPADEVREIAGDVIRRLRYKIVNEDPAGLIEAEDRTLILGFYDDVAIRVTGNEEQARLDVRSASRFGVSDFGHNVQRVRMILREVVARLEETIPSADGDEPKNQPKPAAKPEKERKKKPENQRSSRDRDQ